MKIYYFYSVSCPWCTRLIHFIDLLNEYFEVVRVNIDTDISDKILDMNTLFNYTIFGKKRFSAPLLIIEYVKDGVKRYLFVSIPSEKEEVSSIEKDVMKFVILTLKALSSIGVNVDRLIENEIVKEYFKI